MKLEDLQPHWLNEHVFAFLCPHCKKNWLTCKNVPMTYREQFDLFEQRFGTAWNIKVGPTKPDFSWKFSNRDFSNITVTPSVDASPSGCWHGFITNGNIA